MDGMTLPAPSVHALLDEADALLHAVVAWGVIEDKGTRDKVVAGAELVALLRKASLAQRSTAP